MPYELFLLEVQIDLNFLETSLFENS